MCPSSYKLGNSWRRETRKGDSLACRLKRHTCGDVLDLILDPNEQGKGTVGGGCEDGCYKQWGGGIIPSRMKEVEL